MNRPPLDLDLASLNSMPSGEAEEELLKCCGSKSWAQRMVVERPYRSLNDLIAHADRVWWSLDSQDWLEAFRSHPKIGETKAETTVAAEAQQWSEKEQLGIRNSAQQTLFALAESNRLYEGKFGYIFIVCASGKSAEELLTILRQRLENKPDVELRNAAGEQAKIAELRLRKLLAG